MRFVNAEGIHTEGSRPAARRSLDDRRHIEPHAMIRADVLCDSSVSIRVIRGSTMRFNRRVQRSNSQTRPPPNQGMTKSAIHPSRWLPATLNANDKVHGAAANEFPFQTRVLPPLLWNAYAQHGRELVGCQSPVRKRDLIRRQYAKCFLLSEVQGEGNCGRAIDRG